MLLVYQQNVHCLCTNKIYIVTQCYSLSRLLLILTKIEQNGSLHTTTTSTTTSIRQEKYIYIVRIEINASSINIESNKANQWFLGTMPNIKQRDFGSDLLFCSSCISLHAHFTIITLDSMWIKALCLHKLICLS